MYGFYESPLGTITFEVQDGHLISLMIDKEDVKETLHPDTDQIKHQLDLYFKHEIKDFDLKLQFNRGTPFQQAVWTLLLAIPYGKTKSYQDIANELGNPKAVRAVGQACKRNPIGIVVPCHRVIGKDGSMTGYSGKDYIDLKRKLLELEKENQHD